MPHPVDVYVGKRIRQQRWVAGMTQQQLAESVGIKFQQIQKYETGANRVSASRLWGIAAALNVPVAFFFDGAESVVGDGDVPAATDRPVQDPMAEKEAVELIRTYYSIPEDQRRRLFDLARVLGSAA